MSDSNDRCLENIAESGEIVRCEQPIPKGTRFCKEHNQHRQQYFEERILVLTNQTEIARRQLRYLEEEAKALP